MPEIESRSWDDFMKGFRWAQGEHVAIIAPTGGGKTTLMRAIMPFRKFNVFFGTKPDDPLYRELMSKRGGYKRVQSWDEVRPWDNNILLWPKLQKTIPATYNNQRYQFERALNNIVQQGHWSLYFDECKYMAEQLGMRAHITYALEQLRSIRGTTINGAQRPVWLPRSVLSNSSHVFLWSTRDREDARRLADIGGIDAKFVATESLKLGKHEFIYVSTRGTESTLIRSQVRR